jgi:hypothetical protein
MGDANLYFSCGLFVAVAVVVADEVEEDDEDDDDDAVSFESVNSAGMALPACVSSSSPSFAFVVVVVLFQLA